MRERKLTLPLFVTLALLLVACGPTNADLVETYTPQFDALRADFEAIAAALPPVTGEIEALALDPAPDYQTGSYGEIRNTDIVMYRQLLDPYIELRDENLFDLRFSNYIVSYLRCMGESSPMSATTLEKRADKEKADEYEQALDIAYLGVARVNAYEPPIAIDKDTFVGGTVAIDGFLVDVDTQAVLCAFSITAYPNEEVRYQVRENESHTDALRRFAYSTLWSNAREAFMEKMNALCGGSFVLDD